MTLTLALTLTLARSSEGAVQMLTSLSARQHTVITLNPKPSLNP